VQQVLLPRPVPALALNDVRRLGWALVAAAAAISGTGFAGGARPIGVGAGIVAATMAALLAPQIVLALFLTVAGFKAAPWLSGIPADATLLAAVGVVFAVVTDVIRRGLPVPPRGVVFGLLLTVLVVSAVLWSPDPARGLEKAARFEGLTMLAFAAPIVLVRSRDEMSSLIRPMVAFTLLISLAATQVGASSEPLRIIGSNHIELARYSSLGLLGAAVYLAPQASRRDRILWIAAAAILLHTTLAAGSRGVLVALLLAAVVGLGVLERPAHRAIALLAGVLSIFVFAALDPAVRGQAGDRYRHLLLSTDTGTVLGTREELYHLGVREAEANPMGAGTEGFAADTGLTTCPGRQDRDRSVLAMPCYPHNVELEIAGEYGIPGLALFVSLVVAAWIATKRSLGRHRPSLILARSTMVLFLVEAQVSEGLNGNRLLFFALGLCFAASRIEWAAPAA
jgi:O-antigen ligase